MQLQACALACLRAAAWLPVARAPASAVAQRERGHYSKFEYLQTQAHSLLLQPQTRAQPAAQTVAAADAPETAGKRRGPPAVVATGERREEEGRRLLLEDRREQHDCLQVERKKAAAQLLAAADDWVGSLAQRGTNYCYCYCHHYRHR